VAAILKDSIAAVQDGSAFKPPPDMDELASIGLPSATSAVEMITETWSAATKNLSKILSVTSSQVTVIELEAKSQGREPTEEELDEACGPLGFLTKVPNALSEALSDIFGQVDEFASDFGRAIGEFAGELNELINDVANAIDEVAQEAAQLILDAFNTVNAIAIEALNAVEGAINAAVGFVNDAIAEAEQLFNQAIDKLLGFADSLVFAAFYKLECQETALENAIDLDNNADAAEIDRVISPPVNRESSPPTEQLADIPVSSPTLVEPQTTLAPKTNREQLITYWVDPTDKATGTNIITFLTLKYATNLISKNQEPFGVPRAFKTATGSERKTVLLRNNQTGALFVVIAYPELNPPAWEIYSIAAYEKDLKGVIGPVTKSRNGIIVPDPNLPLEEPTLEPIPVDTRETVQTLNVEEIIQRTKTAISRYNRTNEQTFAIIQNTRTATGPVNPELAAAIKNAIDGNERTRASIISGINSLAPAVAEQVRAAVGPIPPVLR